MPILNKIVNLLPEKSHVCFVVQKLFTANECKELLTDEVRHSFQKADTHYPTSYRNNDRLVMDNDIVSTRLFEKVKTYLPERITVTSATTSEAGIWQLKELNNRLRYCRYITGQYFNRHLDGIHYRSEQIQSKLTFMVYLNDACDFEGGRTLFYKSKDDPDIWVSYLPQQGDLIVFDHNLWHEGETLTAGEKFVLRSDILYERILSSPDPFVQTGQPYQEGHLGYVWKLLFFDEQTLLSGGRDTSIKVWNKNGICQQRLTGHQNSVLCLMKLTDDIFASGSRDKSIRLWRAENGQFSQTATYYLHEALVLSLCKIDSMTFASSGGDSLIRICSLSGQIQQTLHGHTNWVWNVVLLENSLLASCSEDKTIKIWNYRTKSCLFTLYEDTPVHCLAYDHISEQLISGNYAGEISIWHKCQSSGAWTRLHHFQAHQGIIRTLLLAKDKYLVSGGEDNKIRIWDLKKLTSIATYTHANFVQSVVLNSAGQLVSASYDGQIHIWDLPEAINDFSKT